MILPVAFSLIVTPLIMRKLGVESYGLFVVINVLVGLLSLLDFGLIPTLIKSIAFHYEKNDFPNLYKVINSAVFIYLGLGFVVSVLLFFLKDIVLRSLNIEISQKEVWLTMSLAALIFTANGIRVVVGSILNGLQRYDLGAKIMMWNVLLLNFLMLSFVYAGGGFLALISSQLISVVFLIGGYYYHSKKLIPLWKLKLEFDKKLILPELRFGGFAFVNQIASTALFQLDKLLLSAILGPAAVPYYALPGTVAQKMQDVSSSLSGVLFPLSTKLHTSNENERSQTIYRRSITLTAFIMASLAFVVVLFSREIMKYWLGQDFADKSTDTLVVLGITYFVLGVFLPLSNFLLGKGASKDLALINMTMLVIDISAFLWLVPNHGVLGAAWAYMISVAPVPFFFYYAERKYFGITDSFKYYSKLFAKLAVTLTISFSVSFFSLQLVTNLATLLLCMFLSLLFFGGVHFVLGFFEKEDVLLFRRALKMDINK